jgi:RND superfamily putative drug exporter
VNSLHAFPASRESGTTAVTYLGFPDVTGFLDRDRIAHEVRDRIAADPRNGHVGVTGIVPAELHEGRLVEAALPWVEIATVVLIALMVGLKFRAPGAPALTLLTVAVAYVVSSWVLREAGSAAGVTVPTILRPLVVALVLGIVTDYSVFYLSAYRSRLRRGDDRLPAARSTAAEIAPIVLAGGLILAAGLLALLGASISFFRTLGPGLALTVVASLLVAVTLIPALLAIGGRALFWPSSCTPGEAPADPWRRPLRERVARFATRRPVALVTAVVCIAGLGFAALQLRHAKLGFTNISGLPGDAEERRAAGAAGHGFAPGIVSPTQVVLEGRDMQAQRAQLVRLESLVARRPGVAGVVGPREQPFGGTGAAYSRDGNAARLVVILDHDPLSADAIDDLTGLRSSMPGLTRRAGLNGVQARYSGDTAIAAETVTTFGHDLVRIFGLVLVINLLALIVFLRAIVAPLYLVASSVLAVAATFGISTWVFQDLLGYGELTYYVPFAAAVLLVSLGSDYNVFVVGRVWQEARVRPLREALTVAAPRAASAIRAAGITLALSFAMLAIVPLHAFWEFALTMTVGILLETFVVRSLLVPALVSLFGYVSAWPGGGLRLRPGVRGARRASSTRA